MYSAMTLNFWWLEWQPQNILMELLPFTCHKLIASTFPDFTFSSSVRDLGVTLDSELTFADHISLLTRSCYYQPRRLRAIRRSVSPKVFLTIVHAFICTCIDYCNSLLIG